MSGGISVMRKVAATFRTPFQGGPRMADSEPLIERLAAENHEFGKLREEHKKYEEELAGPRRAPRSVPPARESPGFRGLPHLPPAGDARMVDVSAKAETVREAVARVTLPMSPATLAAVRPG